MLYRDEKKRLIELVINHRVSADAFEGFAKKQAVGAPPEMLERWKRRFYARNNMEFPENPKLLNRFCIGADPEFIFGERNQPIMDDEFPDDNPAYVYAEKFGMNTIEAFGADMNGRLAELRVFPNRFVLNVVASLLDTLRWMNEAYPAVNKFKWCAPAIMAKDGIGGHVHIGRRRKDTNEFVKSLDMLVNVLSSTNIVDGVGHAQRKIQTKYGKPSDIRPQPHGIEYRTMPTWLSSPWSAYLTLTLAKLCIFHPLSAAKLSKVPENNFLIIKNLLMAFSGYDDDARIALIAWERMGPPKYNSGDFKQAWGITKPQLKGISHGTHYFPPIIEPDVKSVRELFNFFTNGNPINYRVLEPAWNLYKIPAKIHRPLLAMHYAGIPEVVQGLLSYKIHVDFRPGHSQNAIDIYVPPSFTLQTKQLFTWIKETGNSLKTIRAIPGHENDGIMIYLPTNLQKDYVVNKDIVSDVRAMLTKSGVFPIAKYDQIEKNIPEFEKLFVKKKEKAKMIGNLLLAVNEQGG